MSTEEYKSAVIRMHEAMQKVFEANEELRQAAQVVWSWDAVPAPPSESPSPIEQAAPSILLPRSPMTEYSDEGGCHGCSVCLESPPAASPAASLVASLDAAFKLVPLVPQCDICERKLIEGYVSKYQSDRCFLCYEGVKRCDQDYPDDAEEAYPFGDSALHALALRTHANDNREAAADTEDDAEMIACHKEATRLDSLATRLLERTPEFQPWWVKRWDYFRAPGYQPHPDEALKHKHCTCDDCRVDIVTENCPACYFAAQPRAVSPTPSPKPLPNPKLPPASPIKVRPDYRHRFWPSPRPKNFAKALGYSAKSHQAALSYLAKHANMSVAELLETNPLIYEKTYMPYKEPQLTYDIAYGLSDSLPPGITFASSWWGAGPRKCYRLLPAE